MIRTIINSIYYGFISIVLISFMLAGWTSFTLVTKSTKSSEIIKVVNDMYASQKTVIIGVVNLSKILLKDSSTKITNENKIVLLDTDLPKEVEDNSQLDKSQIIDDNHLRTIEESFSEVGKNTISDLNEEALVNDQLGSYMNEMEIETE